MNSYSGKYKEEVRSNTFHVVKIVATPYEIEFPDWQPIGADALIRHLSGLKECWEMEYYYQYSIFEVERALKNMREKNTIVKIRYPVEKIFPKGRSNIPLATIFIGSQAMFELYDRIRQRLLLFLTDGSS